MPRPARWVLASGVLVFAALVPLRAGAAATNWPAGVGGGSGAQAQGGGLGTPTNITANCHTLTGAQIDVAWTGVPRATSYVVLQSTNGGASYTTAATVATTTWSSSNSLALATYVFAIKAGLSGTNWLGPQSANSPAHTIALTACL